MKRVLIWSGIILGSMLFIGVLFITGVFAHPGRTDSDGGHYCWTNCDYWGEDYGYWHSHDDSDYDAPSWVCRIYSNNPNDSLIEQIGQTFYTHSEAKKYWDSKTREYLKGIYATYLERKPTEKEYLSAIRRSPYNYCKGNRNSLDKITSEVQNSKERKSLLAKREKEQRARFERAILLAEKQARIDTEKAAYTKRQQELIAAERKAEAVKYAKIIGLIIIICIYVLMRIEKRPK